MPVYKCKKCGEAINYTQGQTTVTCSSCETIQSLPRVENERKAELYNKANQLRLDGNFESAVSIYKKILNSDNTDPDIYWNIVLCRYGVRYNINSDTHKWTPAVNSPQRLSIFDNNDYKSAFQYADDVQKEIYRKEAIAINTAQEELWTIVQTEKPYDVYVCCVGMDKEGAETPDNSLAKDILMRFTQEGYGIFASFVNQHNQEKHDIDPQGFAALNSAKVMIVLGTRPDFFTDALIKDEWKKYLGLVKCGTGKVLIPVYRDMDPCDLPEEFSGYESLDALKSGYMEDLLKIVKKALNSLEINCLPNNKQCAVIYDSAVKKMESGSSEEDFQTAAETFRSISGYKNSDTLEKRCLEMADSFRMDTIYTSAKRNMNANLKEAYETAIKEFQTISGWRDADKQVRMCKKNIDKLKRHEESGSEPLRQTCKSASSVDNKTSKKARTRKQDIVSIVIFVIIGLIIGFVVTYLVIPEVKYTNAKTFMNKGDLSNAYKEFSELKGYKDSDEMATQLYEWYQTERLKSGNAFIGDIVYFGSYEQDNNLYTGKEMIEWQILDIKDGKALLLSKYALDAQPYDKLFADTAWDSCSMRIWLNETFMNTAFTTDEQEKILFSEICADRNPQYDTKQGNSTNDKVFLLSIAEVGAYLSSQSILDCTPTKYAEALGVHCFKSKDNNSSCRWWLRSIGGDQKSAAVVMPYGNINCSGSTVNHENNAIRPAIWIQLGSDS